MKCLRNHKCSEVRSAATGAVVNGSRITVPNGGSPASSMSFHRNPINSSASCASSVSANPPTIQADGTNEFINPASGTVPRVHADRTSESAASQQTLSGAPRWSDIVKRRRHSPAVRGSASSADSSSDSRTLRSGSPLLPKRAWLYIGNCHLDSTCDTLKSYLCTLLEPQDIFNIDVLTSKGTNKCFRVIVDRKYLDLLMTADTWPNGVIVRRYNINENDKLQLYRNYASSARVQPTPPEVAGLDNVSFPLAKDLRPPT